MARDPEKINEVELVDENPKAMIRDPPEERSDSTWTKTPGQ